MLLSKMALAKAVIIRYSFRPKAKLRGGKREKRKRGIFGADVSKEGCCKEANNEASN
jgi:hypothetical protein